jgi:MFS family permease
MFAFWHEASPEAHRALIAASLGWLLDAFDVMIYALVLAALMADMGMDRATGGLLGSLTLAASAAGGILFGWLADRVGRTRALSLSILLYSIFTAACGLAQNVAQLALFRVLLGIGFGGEWASGAALVSETWPAKHRGKALGLMQSSWAIGYGLAAIVTALVLPRFGWRAVFLVGVLPALATLWIRRSVPEPAIWLRTKQEAASGPRAQRAPAATRGTADPLEREGMSAYAALRPRASPSRARLSRSLNGLSRRFSVSCVGLCRGCIARRTFGLAMRTFAANSLTPIARITFPRAT